MTSWYGVNPPQFPLRFQERHDLCQEVLQIIRREHDFSLESLRQKILDKSPVSFAVPALSWRVGVDDYLWNASVFPGLGKISAKLWAAVRNLDVWSAEVTSPRPLEGGPDHSSRGSPVRSHEGRDLEVRAMTNIV